uniref:Coenzyme A biosynthesis bifunctional protein CoaBC n=1 Tax=Candidatus Methanophaga sp. ANME-1 ERB7 TaxID=2759913 RepID=A0A7G9Z5U7_9EURY|nr:coenzyme A biosynthesis bifunctional protein CoaBC [Methanosarcinales archaeon ANME-1 ERB7]
MADYKLEMVVANDVGKGGIGTEENEVYIMREGGKEIKRVKGPKRRIAEEILSELSLLKNRK